ncbi:hypothetical protein [Vibrio panuliri]|nr:hypothetical protein [Vibrio panuliri]
MDPVLRRTLFGCGCLLAHFCAVPQAMAESLASYPVGWDSWTEVRQGMIYPAASEPPASASLFRQAVFQSYNWVNGSQGSSVAIFVNPSKLEQYLSHGPYSDGPTIVAYAEEAGLILVTEHIGGEAIFGSYNTKGEDVSHSHYSLRPDVCESCHSTYQEYCSHGVCSDFDEKQKSFK